MITSIRKRLHILLAKLRHDELIRHCSWKDVAHELFKFYGRHTGAIRNRMRISREDGGIRVVIDGRTIYWPGNADLERLSTMYFEVFYERNNHYFDIPGMEIKPGDTVLDCGACEGYFTLKALECGARKVHCIEPGEAIVSCLKKTFADEIATGRVSIHACLLGGSNETVNFYQNPVDPTVGHTGDGAEDRVTSLSPTRMEMLTIDAFCDRSAIEKIDFIKADVEGSEVELLYGAEQTLSTFRPALAIAVYHAPENANLIVDYIESLSLGYIIRVKGIVEFENTPRPVMVHCYQRGA